MAVSYVHREYDDFNGVHVYLQSYPISLVGNLCCLKWKVIYLKFKWGFNQTLSIYSKVS